ncbi:MAG: multicopper oxidase family protein [Pseudomonadota bacterium]
MSTRRRFLQIAGGAAILAGGGPARLLAADAPFGADVELQLTARPGEAGLLPGTPTRIWRYDGEVLRGDPRTLSFLDGSGHIPLLRLMRGQRVRIHFHNRLPEPTIVHWHGLHMPQPMDGHPMYAIEEGETFTYEFEVDTRAGTYWFHPHPHQRTAYQVLQGLTGLLVVHDDEEQSLGLPAGDLDIPLVIQDRRFDGDNQLVHLGRRRMDWMMGYAGDHVLVNGDVDYQRQVPRTSCRLRLFNGSNASTCQLRLSGGRPMTVIGSDGGLLEFPEQRQQVTLAPAERIEVLVDLSRLQAGDELALLAETWSPRLQRLTDRQVTGELRDGGRVIARLIAGDEQRPSPPLPDRLSVYPTAPSLEQAVTRRVTLSMMRGNLTLNGRVFGGMRDVADEERVALDRPVIWEFANDARMGMGRGGGRGMGMGMRMLHPMHVHNVQFRVIGRQMAEEPDSVLESLGRGSIDNGLKDVVLVRPGERVRVLMQFADHTGLYLYHCHILEHEDLGMMRNFLIESA